MAPVFSGETTLTINHTVLEARTLVNGSLCPGTDHHRIDRFSSAAESCDRFWEAGSAATGLLDTLSDLDLQLMVREGSVAESASAVEALQRVAPIEIRYEIPFPTWHGNWQAFYHLRGTSPYLLIDLIIMEERQTNRFLEPEMHGVPIVYFDKQGLMKPAPVDPASFARRLQGRLPALEYPVALFYAFVDKELEWGRFIDAFHFYHGLLLPRLIEALRILHAPWRHNFGSRYLHTDLPADLVPACGIPFLRRFAG